MHHAKFKLSTFYLIYQATIFDKKMLIAQGPKLDKYFTYNRISNAYSQRLFYFVASCKGRFLTIACCFCRHVCCLFKSMPNLQYKTVAVMGST